MAASQDRRIAELLELAAEQGQPLGVRPETVCAVEDAGWMIDPFTGQLWRFDPAYVPAERALGFLATALHTVMNL